MGARVARFSRCRLADADGRIVYEGPIARVIREDGSAFLVPVIGALSDEEAIRLAEEADLDDEALD